MILPRSRTVCALSAALLCAAFAASGCVSASSSQRVYLPGEKDRILRNLAAEYYTLAEGFAKQSQYAKAIGYYELAKRDPSLYRAAYYRQGCMYALNKDWSKAEAVFSDLLLQDPENVTLQASLAYIAAMRGDTEAALAQYESLVLHHPYDADLQINYIYLLLDAGDVDKARAQFAVLARRFPTNGSLETVEKRIAEKEDGLPAGSSAAAPDDDTADGGADESLDEEVISDMRSEFAEEEQPESNGDESGSAADAADEADGGA